jgi:hypothetical protein
LQSTLRRVELLYNVMQCYQWSRPDRMRVREGEVESLEQSRDVLWQGVQGMQGGQATLKLLFEQGVGTERPESAG